MCSSTRSKYCFKKCHQEALNRKDWSTLIFMKFKMKLRICLLIKLFGQILLFWCFEILIVTRCCYFLQYSDTSDPFPHSIAAGFWLEPDTSENMPIYKFAVCNKLQRLEFVKICISKCLIKSRKKCWEARSPTILHRVESFLLRRNFINAMEFKILLISRGLERRGCTDKGRPKCGRRRKRMCMSWLEY